MVVQATAHTQVHGVPSASHIPVPASSAPVAVADRPALVLAHYVVRFDPIPASSEGAVAEVRSSGAQQRLGANAEPW